jgi:hypothetical protein
MEGKQQFESGGIDEREVDIDKRRAEEIMG